MFLANGGNSVVAYPHQRQGLFDGQPFDPGERADDREHGRADAKLVHFGEALIHIVKRFGHRQVKSPVIEDFHAIAVLFDPRRGGAAAQQIDQFGRPPMGMHVNGHR